MKQNAPFIIAFFAALLWFTLDFISKRGAAFFFEAQPIFGDFLYLKPIQHNTGIAFGLPVPLAVQILGSLLILGALIYLAHQHVFFKPGEESFRPLLFGIIIGGAMGNLVDRVTQGHVVDFIVLHPIPVFNVADIGITLGLLFFFVISLREHHPR